jgi:Icc-related predicted phosphoesterase
MKLRRRSAVPRTRWFFATDVHGSDRCFRKFLAAATSYEASVLVLGGDVAGKAIVPITQRPDGRYEALFQDEDLLIGEDELAALTARINFNGLYPWVASAEEITRIREDESAHAALFDQLIAGQVQEWCDLAAERLADDVELIVTPGNDDPVAIDAVLEAHPRVACPERQVMQVGSNWLASLGNTNRTPWDTDREYDEPELTDQIVAMLSGYDDGRPLIFNFHCPPFDSGLDTATALDDELRPMTQHGATLEIPVGSTAVREAILRYAPVVGLHGHIHESPGCRKFGPSVCLNPGSDYSSGYLKGAIVDLAEDGSYVDHLLTTG